MNLSDIQIQFDMLNRDNTGDSKSFAFTPDYAAKVSNYYPENYSPSQLELWRDFVVDQFWFRKESHGDNYPTITIPYYMKNDWRYWTTNSNASGYLILPLNAISDVRIFLCD